MAVIESPIYKCILWWFELLRTVRLSDTSAARASSMKIGSRSFHRLETHVDHSPRRTELGISGKLFSICQSGGLAATGLTESISRSQPSCQAEFCRGAAGSNQPHRKRHRSSYRTWSNTSVSSHRCCTTPSPSSEASKQVTHGDACRRRLATAKGTKAAAAPHSRATDSHSRRGLSYACWMNS